MSKTAETQAKPESDSPSDAETTTVPDLEVMTRTALERLDASRGFLLVVEGGRIDHAGHMNDAAALLGEMVEFDRAVAVAREYARPRPEVAVIVTSDHETGGLCLTYRPGVLPTAADLRALEKRFHAAMAHLAQLRKRFPQPGRVTLAPADES